MAGRHGDGDCSRPAGRSVSEICRRAVSVFLRRRGEDSSRRRADLRRIRAQGFFELVGVAALVLPLLLAAHWLLRKEKARDEIVFRVLAGAQIALLFVMMVSAFQRMRLYQREYGLTELRVYTTVFMGWLAVVFVWFTMTVLRGR